MRLSNYILYVLALHESDIARCIAMVRLSVVHGIVKQPTVRPVYSFRKSCREISCLSRFVLSLIPESVAALPFQ